MFTLLFVLAAVIFVSPQPQKFIAVSLAIIVIFCLLDQTLWQSWFVLCGFLLATLVLFSWDSEDLAERRLFFSAPETGLRCGQLSFGRRS